MKEWHRTILLSMLIILAVVYIIWTHHQAQTNLLNGVLH